MQAPCGDRFRLGSLNGTVLGDAILPRGDATARVHAPMLMRSPQI